MTSLPAGSYTFGTDIAPGAYVVSYASGKGTVDFRRSSERDRKGEQLRDQRDVSFWYNPDPEWTRGLKPIRFEAAEGSILRVEPGVGVTIAHDDGVDLSAGEAPLTAGSYTFGTDIAPGAYVVSYASGKGTVDFRRSSERDRKGEQLRDQRDVSFWYNPDPEWTRGLKPIRFEAVEGSTLAVEPGLETKIAPAGMIEIDDDPLIASPQPTSNNGPHLSAPAPGGGELGVRSASPASTGHYISCPAYGEGASADWREVTPSGYISSPGRSASDDEDDKHVQSSNQPEHELPADSVDANRGEDECPAESEIKCDPYEKVLVDTLAAIQAKKDAEHDSDPEPEVGAPTVAPESVAIAAMEADSLAIAERQKLISWERRLLDLSMRNRLLNLNLGARSGYLPLSEPDVASLWSGFVDESSRFVLPLRTRRDYFNELAEYEEYRKHAEAGALEGRRLRSTRPDEFALGENEAVADLSASDMRKRLKGIRSRARLLSEERGVDALYLAFGLLDWEDKKGKRHNAPLLLVPSSLTIARMAAPYVLERTGDDVVHNVTLGLMLDKDYNLQLPAYEQGQPLFAYLNAVQGVVSSRGWRVTEAAVLGVFSFATINMYNDLEKNGELIMANPVVRAICGDHKAAASLVAGLTPIEQIRARDQREDPLTVSKVVDSDSSQGEAVALAEAGYSFVLQGPPGTGKSQTITNVITGALANGKTVLFVSEKRAALDVVKRRLEEAGLGQFLFVLHDSATKKKDAIKDLCMQLDETIPVSTFSHDTLGRLSKYKGSADKLDAYARGISASIQPLGTSIWKAYDQLVDLEDAPNIRFKIGGIERVDAVGLEKMRSAIASLAKASAALGHAVSESPWKNAATAWANDEYVQDARSAADKAAYSAAKLIAAYEDASAKVGCTADPSLESARALASILEQIGGDYEDWALELEDIDGVQSNLALLSELSAGSADALRKFDSDVKAAVAAGFDLPVASDSLWLEDFVAVEKAATEILSSDQLLSRWSEIGVEAVKNRFAGLRRSLGEMRDLRDDLLATYVPNALSLDARRMLVRFETEYTSFFKRAFGSYNEDISLLTGCRRQVSSQKMTQDEAVSMLRSVCQLQDLEQDFSLKASEYQRDFPGVFADKDTDCESVEAKIEAFESLVALRKEARALGMELAAAEAPLAGCHEALGDRFKGLLEDFAATSGELEKASEIIGSANAAGVSDIAGLRAMAPEERAELARGLRESISDFASSLEDLGAYQQFIVAPGSLSELQQECRSLAGSADELPRVIDCKRQTMTCEGLGLGDFLAVARESRLEPGELQDAFMRRFYTSWINAQLPNAEAVAGFRKTAHEGVINDFCDADGLLTAMARQNVLRKLVDAMAPASDTVDARRLRREANKRSRVMPIRRIFEEMPSLITLLKPCVMMSPLSVSTFLESRSIDFDLVVFDEASQVCTENAVGAISRGKQVIIAGDSRQLPPTDFFSVGLSEEDVDDEEEAEVDTGDFESVLEEASMLPTVDLKWHYRSRNEGLISFSNNEIYEGKLVTFPSSGEWLRGEGVSFEHVSDGVWRGAREGNPVEARRVAELVFEHFAKYPERSVGVIAFGSGQASCIEAEVTALREKDHRFEAWFDEGKPDGFFVKSLENVQGDERDSIFLSVGYARDYRGTMRMNFGPINRAGGERRLNVAVTRAKHDLTLVSSILDTDIVLGERASRGPVVLRDYIAYARKNQLLHDNPDVQQDEGQADCAESTGILGFIKSALERRGYCVELGVGASSCKIDLAVKAAAEDGDYIAGIVTDGEGYVQSRGARERDRIRPRMLAEMGWSLYRVWIPAWASDLSGELEDLLVFVSECAAAAEKRRTEMPMPVAAPKAPVLPEVGSKAFEVEVVEAKKLAYTMKKEPAPAPVPSGFVAEAEPESKALAQVDDAVPVTEKPVGEEVPSAAIVGPAFEYQSYKPRDLSTYQPDFGEPNKYGFVKYVSAPAIPEYVEVDEAVLRFLGAEAPVTSRRLLSFVRKRLGDGASFGDAQDVIARLEDKQLGYGIEVSGNFVRLEGVADPPPRSGGRLFNEIATIEVMAGMLGVFTALIGAGEVTKPTLLRKTYDEFGFAREDTIPADASRTLEACFKTLMNAGFIRHDGPLRLARGDQLFG